MFIFCAVLALTISCSEPVAAPPRDGGGRALGYLKAAQAADGSFVSDSLPAVVSRAFVLGLLSVSENSGGEVEALLNRAAGFLLARQREDGSFGERLTSSVCVMALSSYQRRLRGIREPDTLGVEVFEPAFLDHTTSIAEDLRAAKDEASRTALGRRALQGQREDGGWPSFENGLSDPVETVLRLRVLRLTLPFGGPTA